MQHTRDAASGGVGERSEWRLEGRIIDDQPLVLVLSQQICLAVSTNSYGSDRPLSARKQCHLAEERKRCGEGYETLLPTSYFLLMTSYFLLTSQVDQSCAEVKTVVRTNPKLYL